MKEKISKSVAYNAGSQVYGEYIGEDTEDNVFILSYEDFCEEDENTGELTVLPEYKDLFKCTKTEYAKSKYVYSSDSLSTFYSTEDLNEISDDYCDWWLMNVGEKMRKALVRYLY